ncbi:glycosyltransferase [Aliiroseovarius sp. KMU-50]|uniref:Glycosyltransferase n=1 Tax=Aliiroseovarius salicola TaxID=3009082 RepID=A0ABT4VXU3_9RHOB|nr:glycosyltransferase [Aliiroseovarius sp. KMU-50]MDA5093074.1 glycosyltransferase [Aliiroseovarius sp. KMU-50]
MVALIIPVLNGGVVFEDCLAAIGGQTLRFNTKLVLDSGSSDGSRDLALKHGFEVWDVPHGTFNHGGTRSLAASKVKDDILLFLTQDAVLNEPEAAAKLVAAFEASNIAAAFGRQLPHHDADDIATHARLRSYGTDSYVTSITSSYPAGIRKCFLSNSFAAYRREALQGIGGFPSNVILAEDMFVAARLLQAGWSVAYVAEARARHSHNYTIREEFRRYFDTGVFQKQQAWILEEFGRPEGEGVRVALDQVRYLWRQNRWGQIPRSLAVSSVKYFGYKLGLRHDRLGQDVSRRLAMHKRYFAE